EPRNLIVRVVPEAGTAAEFRIPNESVNACPEISHAPGPPNLPNIARGLREFADAAARTERDLSAARTMVAGLETELEETNRGVMALYSELDDRADKLRRADELKSRFLSYASHELRTPLNGIVGLVRLLQSQAQPRGAEERKQLE